MGRPSFQPEVPYRTCPRCSSAMKHACSTMGRVDVYWCEQDGVLVKYDELTDTIVSTWIPKGLIEAFGKLQEDKDNLLIKQAAALDEIEEVLNEELCWEHADTSLGQLNQIINKFRGR
jgi:nitrate reductase NapAB chaperone NapD